MNLKTLLLSTLPLVSLSVDARLSPWMKEDAAAFPAVGVMYHQLAGWQRCRADEYDKIVKGDALLRDDAEPAARRGYPVIEPFLRNLPLECDLEPIETPRLGHIGDEIKIEKKSDVPGWVLQAPMKKDDVHRIRLTQSSVASLAGLENVLMNLVEAHLVDNRLNDITALIPFNDTLRRVWLSRNDMPHTPAGLTQLTNLEKLCLDTNQLTSLAGLEALTNLSEKLCLRGNRLQEIPELAAFAKLEELDIRDNGIAELKEEWLPTSGMLRKIMLDNQVLLPRTFIEEMGSAHPEGTLVELWTTDKEVYIKGLAGSVNKCLSEYYRKADEIETVPVLLMMNC